MKQMKFVETNITFSEFPDEIALCINISNCPCHCPGCHSSYLANDIGKELNQESLDKLITKGISLVGFMGGDANPLFINILAKYVKDKYGLKVGWYSGRDYLPDCINLNNFDYIKLGPYIEKLGGLQRHTTNQRFYKILRTQGHIVLLDITKDFFKDGN